MLVLNIEFFQKNVFQSVFSILIFSLYFPVKIQDKATCESTQIITSVILQVDLSPEIKVGMHFMARKTESSSRVGKDLPLFGAHLLLAYNKLVLTSDPSENLA